jgi:hypothetical protein
VARKDGLPDRCAARNDDVARVSQQHQPREKENFLVLFFKKELLS